MKNALAQDSEDWTDELDEPEDIQRVLTWLEEASNHEKDLCLVLEGSL
jgi:predicted dienelactone hydrolase